MPDTKPVTLVENEWVEALAAQHARVGLHMRNTDLTDDIFYSVQIHSAMREAIYR